jgi:hypothetical protein
MSPRPRLAAALVVALALALPPRVRADAVPLPAPPPGTERMKRTPPPEPAGSLQLTPPFAAVPPGTAPAPAPTSAAAAPPPPPSSFAPAQAARPRPSVRWAITAGFDYGFNELLSVKMEGGGSQSISANEGLFLSVGAAFLPLLDGRLETQATVGVKGWSIDASNGNLSITMFPLEVLEAFRADPLRLSAGVVFVPGPSTSAGGVLASLDGVKFDNSLGLVLQGEWLSVFKNGRGQISCGPRFVLQKFQIAHGGAVLRANALGFVTSVAFR